MARARIGVVLTLALLAIACGGERPRTQVMLVVDADATVRAETTTLAIEIRGRATGATAWEGDFDRSFVVASTGWPIEVAMIPANDDASREWRATVRALDASGAARLEARAIGPFVAEQTLAHRILLAGRCVGVAACDEQSTCGADGACVSAQVEAGSLVPYVPPGSSDAGTIADGGEADDASASDAGTDAGPCEPVPTTVDLLLMVDNSNSMAEEQASLADTLPAFVMALSSGDVTGDGVRDVEPIDSLHIGVITSDMGTGGVDVPTCTGGTFGSMHGDDGVLRTRSVATTSLCSPEYPPVFEFLRGTGDLAVFAADVACVAAAGTGGCGFEQQLEATLKAVAPRGVQSWTSPDYAPISFFGDTSGHGSDANHDFVRDDSVLALVLLTDEEDCSAADPEIFDPDSATYGSTDLNLRCFRHPEALHGVSRYVDGLLSLRRDPRQLVFAGIVGIPVDATPGSNASELQTILDLPGMIEEIDPALPSRVRPSCNVDERGIAFPPRRIVEVARDLHVGGAATAIHSICQVDYQPAVRSIARRIGERLAGTCR